MLKMNMSMTEKIKAGKLFTDMCEGLPEKRLRGKTLMYEFNHSHPSEVEKRESLIKEMFATVGENAWVEPPVYFSYGSNIHIGRNFYANFNLTIVDDYTVTIGDNVLIAPNVTLSVTGHPVHHELRKNGEMYSFPITIGNNVWIGAGVLAAVAIGAIIFIIVTLRSPMTKEEARAKAGQKQGHLLHFFSSSRPYKPVVHPRLPHLQNCRPQ